jgi:flagellar biosynthetic protein FliQ
MESNRGLAREELSGGCMSASFIQSVAFDTLMLILMVSAPAMLVALVVGLVVSILQATTQVNEMTLAYIPKIVGIYATLIAFGGFIIERLMTFTRGIFSDFSRFIQ